MSLKNFIVLVIGFVLFVLISQSVFIVHQTERALLLQFGAVVKNDLPAGLQFAQESPLLCGVLEDVAELTGVLRQLVGGHGASSCASESATRPAITRERWRIASWRFLRVASTSALAT